MADSRPPSDDARDDDDLHDGDRRRLFERTVPDVLRKIVERAVGTGVETLTEGPDNLRKHLGDLKLPKEAASYVYEQIDDTKKGLYRVVAKEIRDVLEHMSLADEIATVLTKLSFEINTQIRFVPNQAAKEGEAPRAEEGEPPQPAGTSPSTGEGEPKRKSHFPRPRVVSKVVMKAVDMVTGAGAAHARGENAQGTTRNANDAEE
ncbi:MAG: hypothetical protein FJ096_14915 [Deltaproteobacteria bacterium]|nr:hypothetical protein [Deltaproteobacteria bacterium]